MFFNESEKIEQLKICLLFMEADGESSRAEMKYLDDIASKMDLSDSGRQEFQAFCGRLLLNPLNGDSSTVIQEIDRLLDQKASLGFWLHTINSSKTLQAQTIWTLINLGYADNEYSKAEKEVVKHLVERWEMDPTLISELTDTADTILALTKQKEWVQNAAKPYKEVSAIVEEIDQNIASMFANVETTIEEAEI